MVYVVKHYSVPVAYVADENAADVYILRHQGMSVDWARQYEGWRTAPADDAPDNTTHHMVPYGDKGRRRCEYCKVDGWQLVANIGDTDITQYQCPKAK